MSVPRNKIIIGEYHDGEAFWLDHHTRRRHVYVVGKTGTGKSTLLHNMIVQHFEAGDGVILIDPHGDLSSELLDYVPQWRSDDLVYFNPQDLEHPIGFNVLGNVPPEKRGVVADEILAVFKHIFIDSWGARLEYFLLNAILALLETPGNTLLGIARMFTDDTYRVRIVAGIKDTGVRDFWTQEFPAYGDRKIKDAMSPILNKVGRFKSSPVIRNIVGQVHNKIDLRFMIDNKRILLVNLSKGALGEETSKLLGSLFVTKLSQSAMSRDDIPEEQRVDAFLFVDEFQNFATQAFASTLAEARKYRLSLCMSNQYLAQIKDNGVRDAVLGNAGTLCCFTIGTEDADRLEKKFHPYPAQELSSLPLYRAYIRAPGAGGYDHVCETFMCPKGGVNYNNRDKLIELSRARFAVDRELIEKRIERFFANTG